MGSTYSVPEPTGQSIPDPLISTWREIQWGNSEDMLEKVRKYKTKHKKVRVVNLLLVGAVGSGKSSFLNTIDGIFKGQISATQEARTAFGAAKSVTTEFRILHPGGKGDKTTNFNICDTMGMAETSGLNMNDLGYVLDGNVPNGFKFNLETRITPSSKGFIRKPTLKEKMHCMAYVVDGTKVYLAPGEMKQQFDQLIAMASDRGIRVVILITHIDEVCMEVVKDVKKAYSSLQIRRCVDKTSKITGIPASMIFLVKNYKDETTMNTNVNALALTALQKMLDYSDDILDNLA